MGTQRVVRLDGAGLAKWRGALWPHIVSICRRGCGRAEPDDLWKMAEDGHLSFWVLLRDTAATGLLVTQLVAFPRARELRIVATSGHRSLPDPHAVIAQLGDWARSQDCIRLSITGQLDFVRALPGLQVRHVTAEMDLEPARRH